MRITARPDCSPKNADPFITDNRKRMTEQDTNHKGGRPKAIKGKARTKTISTRLTLAEWKIVNEEYAPVCVKTERVDGVRIKEDTYYKLENGVFVEA